MNTFLFVMTSPDSPVAIVAAAIIEAVFVKYSIVTGDVNTAAIRVLSGLNATAFVVVIEIDVRDQTQESLFRVTS